MLSGAAVAPQDPAQLQVRLAAVMAFLEDQTSTVERLRAERDSLRAERDTAAAEIDKLRLMIRQLLRAQYGRRSETLDADQLQLGLEDVEQSLGTAQAPAPAATKTPGERRPAQRNRGALPPHLPRYEVIVDIDDKSCPCCGGPLHVIGEDVLGDARRRAGSVSGQGDPAPAVWLPRLRGCGGAGAGAGAPADRRHRHRGGAGAGAGSQVFRASAALPPGAGLRPPRHRPRPLHFGKLGRTDMLVAAAAGRVAARHDPIVAEDLRRRHAGAGARSRARAHQDRSAVGLCPR